MKNEKRKLQNAPTIPNYRLFRILSRVFVVSTPLFSARVPEKPMGKGIDLGLVGKSEANYFPPILTVL